jgi:hypothetical protein
LVNFKEPGIRYPYKKEFVKVGIKTLLLDTDEEVLEGNCKIYSEYCGETEEITNFSISDNIVKLPYSLRKYEKISIVNTVNDIKTGFIFVAHSYLESDEIDDCITRKFVDITTYKFEIPENNIGSRKVIVYTIKPNGSKSIPLSFEEKDGCVILPNKLSENDRVQVSVIDYRRIYDKIYTYEDIYGNSNNIARIDGNKFLRANYEEGRPSELAVSYPLDGGMIYKETKNGEQELYQINWKNDQEKLVLSPTMQTEIIEDVNIGDKIIKVANGNRLFKPQIGRTKKILPGKLLVNSEIIEYHEMNFDGDVCTLSGIRRASNGSVLNEFLPAGTVVTAYPDQAKIEQKSRSIYISTLIKEGMENKFIIPSKFIDNSKVIVYKKPHISLLTDITFKSKYFDISSNNIMLPGPKKLAHIGRIRERNDKWIAYDDSGKEIGIYDSGNILNEDGEIFATVNDYGYVLSTTELDFGQIIINGDIIYFKSITEMNGKYRIRDFNIDKEYKASESIIYSKDYEILDSSEYEIICNQAEDEKILLHIDGNYVCDPKENQIGIWILEDEKKKAYYTSEKDTKYGYEYGGSIYKNDTYTPSGVVSSEWDNIAVDYDNNILGYIVNHIVYEFNKDAIIGYINSQDEVVDENGHRIEYPYNFKYKDAYVILNETPKPLECIMVGNEK